MGELADATSALSLSSRPVETLALLAALSLLPFAAVMLTSFAKMSVVLSLLRTALGTQQAPPTVVLTGLAGVLSWYVMAPVAAEVLERSRRLPPVTQRGVEWVADLGEAAEPLRGFLHKHSSEAERHRLVQLAEEVHGPGGLALDEGGFAVLVPAFMLTELREAFQLGFLVFLPFLVLDMVVANVLLALGMQTLSPTQVSLPFKLLLFAAADGWGLVARGLVLGYR